MILKLFKTLVVKLETPGYNNRNIDRYGISVEKHDNFAWYKIPYYAVDCRNNLITIGYYEGEGITTLNDLSNKIVSNLEPKLIITGDAVVHILDDSEKYEFEKTMEEIETNL